MNDPRRRIPRTDTVLTDPRLAGATATLGHDFVKSTITAAQQRARTGEITPEAVADVAVATLPGTVGSLRHVLNATGVLIHTNLARAPLSRAAATAVWEASGHTDVEFDLSSGKRSRRGGGALAALRDAVPAADDVHIVNNNAAALVLCALTLAADKEIVISRGELVEIGDGFRIPELLSATGARLREVGTTNRTDIEDYRAAIGPNTGFVLKVHPSNFRIAGFTSTVEVAELAELGHPVVFDIGSGLLRPHTLLPDEPDAATALRDGASVVTASGDKLLGGPQAGLLFGSAELIGRLRAHPTARALRVDKLALAALEATLRGPTPPVHRALEFEQTELHARAERITAGLPAVDAYAVDSVATLGGGAAPGAELPSAAISLPADRAAALRGGDPAVVGRVEHGRCLLDLRTVAPEDDGTLCEAIQQCR